MSMTISVGRWRELSRYSVTRGVLLGVFLLFVEGAEKGIFYGVRKGQV